MSNTKRFGCISVFLLILLFASLLFNVLLLGAKATSKIGGSRILAERTPEFDEEALVAGSSSTADKIVQIAMRGIISSSIDGTLGETMVDDLKMAMRQAADDKNVKAIVLYVDSPGGEVTASDMIYDAVKKAREKKPVVIYMGSLAASGGYYVSCAGSWLMANETTITGSIGVIIQTLNYQQLLGKIGLRTVVFKSGQFKDILSGSREMTPEEAAYIQNMVMQTYGKFVGIVATERKLPEEDLRNGIADGRVISGKDALGFKLVNQLGQIEDAYEKARELGHAPGAPVVRYKAGFHLGRLFRIFGKSETSKIEVSLGERFLPQLESGKLYLLPSFYAP
jgi:protease IV